jgi:processive 1,2-diacylglycerol beta-glucosyltransferase
MPTNRFTILYRDFDVVGAEQVNVLLFTASYGDGHNQAAQAIMEEMERLGISVQLVDYVDWLHPAVRSFTKFSLVHTVTRLPSLYGLFYRSMSKIPPSSSLQRRLHHLGMSKMRRCLRQFSPDVVVSTFPTPAGVLSELKSKGLFSVPSIGVLTDYTAHGQWVQEHTDAYFVATENVASELAALGVDPLKIFATGIPVRSKFHPDRVRTLLAKRDVLRERFGFQRDVPLVLMSGGGEGLLGDTPEWEQVIRHSGLQFAILCGHNERLLRRYENLGEPRVKALGFRSDIEEWMAAADLMLIKAGGLTISEALAMQLPMAIFRPNPGQEQKNAAYATEMGAAMTVANVTEAEEFLRSVERNPEQLYAMRHTVGAVPRLGGAEEIVSTICRLVKTAEQGKPSGKRELRRTGSAFHSVR